jgi:type I restriction enzyme S subunit
LGVPGRIPLDGEKYLHNQRMGLAVVNNTAELDLGFLYYLFLSPPFNQHLFKTATGAKILHTAPGRIENFRFSRPPLGTQQRIASILSTYGGLVDNNTRRITILAEMAMMIYREWFVSFRFPGHEKVKMVESEIGPIPSGWKIFKFSELLESSLGGGWGSDIETGEETSPVMVIRGTDFDDVQSGNRLRSPRRFITSASLGKRKLLNGDIVIENSVNAKTRCTGNSLLVSSGLLRRIQGDCIAASFCRVFRLKNTDLAPLIYLHLRHLYREGRMSFYQNVAANGIANFQTSRFVDSEPIVLPTDAVELQTMLSTLGPLTASNPADKIYNLRRTRDLLLPKLVSGEIDVEKLESEAVTQGV